MSNSRTRIPSPARSMPLTPRRRETPRKTRSVCSPARSNASGRLSCIIREHKEQALGSFVLSPFNRRSVLTDNTDIVEPGRQSWWRDLGENSRDVMEVLNDNNPEPHNIFENIQILSQEEKRYTLDLPDSSDSESIQSIILPQRKLFHEKENQPQTKLNQFGTRETLEKLYKTNVADKNVRTATKQLFQTKQQSRLVFPSALLDISTNTTASEKTIAAVVETKASVHTLFTKQQNEKSQRTKRKNMFAKFIASDSEEELPEIQPKFFALQKKTDSRRPSLASRGFDMSMTSSMDIELDDWQLLPSSTMVEHQLNTTLTTGQNPKRPRLSKLSEAETGTHSSDTFKTKQSNKSNSSKIQEKSLQQEKSIVTRNSSKITKDVEDEINKIQNKSRSSSNISQSSIVTRSKNKSDVANKSRNTSLNKSRNTTLNKSRNTSLNKSRNLNKSKNASKASITQTDNENVVNKSVSKSNQNVYTENKEHENGVTEPADHENDELNFSLQYKDDSADEVEANATKNKSASNKSNKEINASENTTQKHIDFKENSTKNVTATDKNVEKAENKVIEESAEICENNKSHISTQNANESVLNDENVEETAENKSKKSHGTSEIDDDDRKNKSKEQSQEIEQENYRNNEDRPEIEKNLEESENKQNESENKQNETQEELNHSREVHNESEEKQNESLKMQNEGKDEHNESQEEDNVSQDIQYESQEIQNNTQEEEEEEENESEAENNESEEEIEDEQNDSQEEIEQNESEVDDQDLECEDANESVQADNDQADYDGNQENDSDHIENEENDSDQENYVGCEDANESIEAAADSDHNDSQENDSDHIEIVENDSDPENDMEPENANESNEATAESDQNEDEENESDQNDNGDQIENTETPNVSHDTVESGKKSVTPEAILRYSNNGVDLTTVHGQNRSIRKTKSMHPNIESKHRSLEPARESLELSDGTKNSSVEGSGWDSHRTTRKTLRQTFGKDFTPRKSLRAWVMEKSAKRRATAIDETVAMPQANSTEFPVPEMSTNDYEVENDPPVHEISLRTRQAKITEILERAKQDWADMDAKAAAVVKQRLEQGRTRTEDPFKKPAQPIFLRPAKPKKAKTKKPLHSTLMPLDNMPEEFIQDMQYKPPKRFAPRNAAWLTKRLYKYLETKLEPKYKYKSRVRAEKFAQTLYEFVSSARRRGAPAVAPPHAVDALKREMARLNFVKTHFDFYNFFHDFMPREVRVKVIPDIVNNIPHPRNGIFSDIL